MVRAGFGRTTRDSSAPTCEEALLTREEEALLTREENELLTRTGPGTPMGAVLRRYWLPMLLAWELPGPDCPPVRVKLLGERLVAFRDTSGRVGLLAEGCPHRGASLWLGRNEENGLRCVFHGWKFDVSGQCVDQMNEPVSFAAKVRAQAYVTVEVGGVIWAYLGPPDEQPPDPLFEWTQAPGTHRHATKVAQECNWLQALEGGVDVSHVPILHRTLGTRATGYAQSDPFVKGRTLRLEIDPTDYGYRYYGLMELDAGELYVRAYHFVMPFTQIRPEHDDRVYGHMWVPVDDETCTVWNWYLSTAEPLSDEERSEERFGNGPDDVDQATFRSVPNRRNDYFIDRDAQARETFTGIPGINVQDRAVQETMGPVVDRSREHLGGTDRTLIVMRQQLLDAVRAVRDGAAPPGTGTSYYDARGVLRVLPRDSDWRALLLPLVGGG